MTDTLGSRIRFAREARNLRQEDVAERFSIRRESVAQWEADSTKPNLSRLAELASFLTVSFDWLLKKEGAGPKSMAAPRAPRRGKREVGFTPEVVPGEQLLAAGRIPVYAAAMGGSGHSIISFERIDSVKVPSVLENVPRGYGLLIKGGSMYPVYKDGDVALINPHLPPARDSDVVLYHLPPDGLEEAEAIIKQLNGWTDSEWHLEQFQPAMEFAESRIDWPVCHRVVGKYNRR